MSNGRWIALAGLTFVVGVVAGVVWQAYVPVLNRTSVGTAGGPAAGLVTASGDLKQVVVGAKGTDVYYPRPFASPPALTFTRPEHGTYVFEVLEQRADGFKIRASAISTAEYPRWEATGRPVPD
jgi:hypothetical protein